tara:strand:- start:479 stop:643 length:165 start_codon:yes stop_codon:yes gene_type:complete
MEPTQVRQDKHGNWMPCHTCVTASWIDDTYNHLSDEDIEHLSDDIDAVGLHNEP